MAGPLRGLFGVGAFRTFLYGRDDWVFEILEPILD